MVKNLKGVSWTEFDLLLLLHKITFYILPILSRERENGKILKKHLQRKAWKDFEMILQQNFFSLSLFWSLKRLESLEPFCRG